MKEKVNKFEEKKETHHVKIVTVHLDLDLDGGRQSKELSEQQNTPDPTWSTHKKARQILTQKVDFDFENDIILGVPEMALWASESKL